MRYVIWLVGLVIVIAGAVFVLKRPESLPVPAQVTQPFAVSTMPPSPVQGDPVEVAVEGVSPAHVSSITFDGHAVGVDEYEGRALALVGTRIKAVPGTYPVVARLIDGRIATTTVTVGRRLVTSAPLGIPESLGGTTASSEQALVSNLAQENALLDSLSSTSTQLWSGAFQWPLKPPLMVTDPYGYTRVTGAVDVAHEGTDFRAAVGTPVYAMNGGVVRLARPFTDYGDTVVIDHGLGLETLYLHLSRIDVVEGQMVTKGEEVGLSGQSGYAVGPHLHISVKLQGVSVDPLRFMSLVGEPFPS